MANGYSAGDLYLNIDSVATDTLKNLDAVIDRLNIINKGLGGISKVTKATEIATKSTRSKKQNKTFDNFLNIGKWTAVLYSAKRLGGYMAKVVQYGADYTETLNLWETAMGGNLTVATEFVNKMNEAYGISEKTLMNAQAIFKNMLGSLGQISDTMAYALSEGVTQMALDYASLYNVTFEQAFTKFQAALAGQVRPIRSVAGYDITENTLFQLYQSLGGTKTMRQLSRTEKQLLSILAIFNQMNASGAVGDLNKTMESFANQSRVMAEGWQRTMTYSGVILTHLIEQSGLMTYLNAVLIFLGDTIKAVAENMGAIKSFADPFESTTEGALDASEAIDEVKGKLLGFDKFRSLSGGAEDNALGLDEKLLEALAGFDSILGNADMEAQKLAEKFKILSGLFDEDGVFNPDRWNEITTAIKQIGGALLAVAGIIVGAMFGKAIIGAFDYISLSILEVMTTTKGLTSNVTLLGKVFSFIITHPIIAVLVAVGAYLFYLYTTNEEFRLSVNNLFKSFKPLFTLLGDLIKQILPPLGNLLGATFDIIDELFIFVVKQAIPILQAVVVMILPVAYALEFVVRVLQSLMEILTALFTFNFEGLGSKLKSIWGGKWASFDFANSAIGQFSMNDYAGGGLPDKGTIFRAGEAGAEIVYNMPNGQSGVANVRQIEQAMYNALARYGEQNGGAIVVQAYLDGEKVYENTTARAKSQGFVWAKA